MFGHLNQAPRKKDNNTTGYRTLKAFFMSEVYN